MATHRITKQQAHRIAFLAVCCLFGIEGMAAFHFYVDQRDVFAAAAIGTAWAKEIIKAVVEHFV